MANSPVVARINALLAEKGISKQTFYSSCGITSASYSLWNTGKTQPRMKNLETIAEFLGVSVSYILEGVPEKTEGNLQTAISSAIRVTSGSTSNSEEIANLIYEKLAKQKSPAPEGAERIPGYSKLSDTNRAIVDSMIAQLLAAQSED